MISVVKREWLSQLEALGDSLGASVKSLVGNVHDMASTTIELEMDSVNSTTSTVLRSPDGSFRHINEQYPSIVLEVSYSQQRKDLAKIADDYVIGSGGDIAVVVGIDIDYKNTTEARVMVWRPLVVEDDTGQTFVSDLAFSGVSIYIVLSLYFAIAN